jgi:hypothetical protein
MASMRQVNGNELLDRGIILHDKNLSTHLFASTVERNEAYGMQMTNS